MRNRLVTINFLSFLLLASAIGLLTYWAARPLRGQAAANQRALPTVVTTPRHSTQTSRPFAALPPNPARRPAAPEVLQGMPLAFIENRGQADARAAFLVQGRDTTAYFTGQGLTLAFAHGLAEKAAGTKSNVRQRWNLKLDFVGASPAVIPSGNELAKAQVSYFSGPPLGAQSLRAAGLVRKATAGKKEARRQSTQARMRCAPRIYALFDYLS